MTATTATAYYSDARDGIIRLIEAWGKRTLFRYLRDHNMLEAITQELPLKDYKATDEAVIQKIVKKAWDDFSPEKFEAMRKWEMQEKEGSLGLRLATFAADLNRRGFRQAAIEMLRRAEQIDLTQDQNLISKQVAMLEVGDMLVSAGGQVGFTLSNYPGKIRKLSRLDNQIQLEAHVIQTEDVFKLTLDATEEVKVAKLVRPRQARALRAAALAKLIEAEHRLINSPLQAKIARIRYMVEQELNNECQEEG